MFLGIPEKQPLLSRFETDHQPAQYQRAEKAFDEDEERDIEEAKFKYVVGRPSMKVLLFKSTSIFHRLFLIYQLDFERNLVMKHLNHVHSKMKVFMWVKNQSYQEM